MENNKLVVKSEEGLDIELEVLDILSAEYKGEKKEYIVYRFEGNDAVYISILVDGEDTYSIERIESQEEYDFIQKAIDEDIVGDEDE